MEPGTSRLEALWHCIGSWFKGLKASSLNTKKKIYQSKALEGAG
jgi:hypothetical protein